MTSSQQWYLVVAGRRGPFVVHHDSLGAVKELLRNKHGAPVFVEPMRPEPVVIDYGSAISDRHTNFVDLDGLELSIASADVPLFLRDLPALEPLSGLPKATYLVHNSTDGVALLLLGRHRSILLRKLHRLGKHAQQSESEERIARLKRRP